MDDKDLKEQILEELDFEPRVDATHIGVTVENGIVSLFGHVRSFWERMAAETATQRVRGVRAIANEIEVNLPGDAIINDDEIARRAVQIMVWDPILDSDPIQIRVQHGQLDLEGEVVSIFQKARAEDLVSHLPGVRGIYNHLTVNPAPAQTDLKIRIEQALHRQADEDAKRVHVSVENGQVILTGQVDSLVEKEIATKTASLAPGVRQVINSLTVGD